MKRIILISITLLTLFLTTACGARGSRGASQSGEQMKKETANVAVKTISLDNLDKTLQISGKLEGIAEVILYAEVSGKISTVNKKLGQWVNKGEAIAAIDNDQYRLSLQQAEASLVSAESTLEAEQLSLDAASSLLKADQISEADYKRTLSQFNSAKANHSSAQAYAETARLNYESAIFTAPVSGWITYINLNTGDYVSPGSPLIKIVDDRQLIMETGVGESEITNLNIGQTVAIKTRNDIELTGFITGLGKSPAPGSMSYPVKIQFDNTDNTVISGAVVTGEILEKTYENIIYLSLDNITKSYDKYYVYLVDDNNTARKVEIQPGQQIDSYLIIQSGLSENDLLITDGYESLNDGDPVTFAR